SGPRRGSCFFLPAEDGIRDRTVTGVQTCALPILGHIHGVAGKISPVFTQIIFSGFTDRPVRNIVGEAVDLHLLLRYFAMLAGPRSEERRVGKACGASGAPRPVRTASRSARRR